MSVPSYALMTAGRRVSIIEAVNTSSALFTAPLVVSQLKFADKIALAIHCRAACVLTNTHRYVLAFNISFIRRVLTAQVDDTAALSYVLKRCGLTAVRVFPGELLQVVPTNSQYPSTPLSLLTKAVIFLSWWALKHLSSAGESCLCVYTLFQNKSVLPRELRLFEGIVEHDSGHTDVENDVDRFVSALYFEADNGDVSDGGLLNDSLYEDIYGQIPPPLRMFLRAPTPACISFTNSMFV